MYIKLFLQVLISVLCSCLLLSCQESDLGGLTLSVKAEPHYEYYLEVEKTSLSLTSGTQDINLTITTNDTWVAECSESWINITRKEGDDSQKLSFKVAENVDISSRSGTLIVKGKISGLQLQILVEQAGKASETKSYTVNGVTFKMISVRGGTFQMGATSEQTNSDSDEKPVHSVTLSDYSIGETEVTQELWKAVMGSNPSYFSGNNLPVEEVSWGNCQEFIKKLNNLTGANFRLPTEAEWEYAARGGNQSRNTQYAGSNNIDEVAWYYDNSGRKTHAVKTKQPNELGLYDMSGNVWEWCQDWYGNYSSSSQTNPTGPSSGSYCVGRGGSWRDGARDCRSANRPNSNPSYSLVTLGLRLAL